MKCPKCNMTMSENTRFCAHCGTVNPKFDTNQNTSNTSVCSSCNMEVSNSSRICGKCGNLNPNYDANLVNLNDNVNNTNSNPQEEQTSSSPTVIGFIFYIIGGFILINVLMFIIAYGVCFFFFSLS